MFTLFIVLAADLTVLAHVKFQILLGKRNPAYVILSTRKNVQLTVVSGEHYVFHQGSSSSKVSPFKGEDHQVNIKSSTVTVKAPWLLLMLFPGFIVKLGLTDKLLIHLSLFLILFISCSAAQLGPDLVGRHILLLVSLWTF